MMGPIPDGRAAVVVRVRGNLAAHADDVEPDETLSEDEQPV